MRGPMEGGEGELREGMTDEASREWRGRVQSMKRTGEGVGDAHEGGGCNYRKAGHREQILSLRFVRLLIYVLLALTLDLPGMIREVIIYGSQARDNNFHLPSRACSFVPSIPPFLLAASFFFPVSVAADVFVFFSYIKRGVKSGFARNNKASAVSSTWKEIQSSEHSTPPKPPTTHTKIPLATHHHHSNITFIIHRRHHPAAPVPERLTLFYQPIEGEKKE